MFIDKQDAKSISTYTDTIIAISALSKLFSDSHSPYIGYRVAENIFCNSFQAENLARADCSADAKKNACGIAIKTFLNSNGKSLQKIAEFNKESSRFKNKESYDLIKIISMLRNERINFTKRAYGIKNMIYHCLVRDPNRIMIYETKLDSIDIDSINDVKETRSNTIVFKDSKNDYSFNTSKSTLYKRFVTEKIQLDLTTSIIDNPYELLRNLASNNFADVSKTATLNPKQFVILPFFAGHGLERNVPERSGLNQWNASGRHRDPDEIYIKIPSWIHREFPSFFPERDVPFNLKLPDGSLLNAKVCQQGKKALMTNPNKALGKWLLRKVLSLEPLELLKYQRLQVIGIDSVIIYKDAFAKYRIDFKTIGSYDDFYAQHNF
ncbi:MAG: hypothetical protein ACLKAL_10910 [Alkaliphilus sp.]